MTVGPDDRRIVNIAHGDEEIWMLIGHIQREWPQLFRKWLDAHPDIHPTLKRHLPPPTISVQWAEKVWKFDSRTRPGRKHNVTRVRGKYSCDCEASMYGNECWAIQRARKEDATNSSGSARKT